MKDLGTKAKASTGYRTPANDTDQTSLSNRHRQKPPRGLHKDLSKPSSLPRVRVSKRQNGTEDGTHIDNAIATRHKARRVASKKDGQIIQLVRIAQPMLRRHRRPDLLLALERRKPVQRRVHVARRDAVDADTVTGPFGGEGFAELDDGGFGGVVAALFLRVVDDGAGHAGDEDDGAAGALGDHLAAAGLGDEEGAGEVDREEVVPFGVVVFLGFDVGAVGGGCQDHVCLVWSVDSTYSAMPAELMTTSTEPNVAATLLTTSAIALPSRISAL